MAFRNVGIQAFLLWLASFNLAEACRLALVLALDVSSSVDAEEHHLQRQGLAQAMIAPEVVDAFLLGEPVALYVFEFADQVSQHPLLPGWQMVKSLQDLEHIASAIAVAEERSPDPGYVRTAIGAALAHAALALAEAPDCTARIVDVAGDGANNEGLEPAAAYQIFPFHGVTVNALIIGRVREGVGEVAEWHDLKRYNRLVGSVQRELLHGPGSFWVFANGYEDYQRAMQAKLLRELRLPVVSGWPASADAG